MTDTTRPTLADLLHQRPAVSDIGTATAVHALAVMSA